MQAPAREAIEDGIVERVRTLADRQPSAVLLRFVDDAGEVQRELARAELVAEAAAVGGYLLGRCGLEPGDRAALVYPPSVDFVTALLGCLFAGVVPVPLYPPNPLDPEPDLAGFSGLLADCGARVVLSNRLYSRARKLGGVSGVLKRRRARWPRDVRWFDTDARAALGHAPVSPHRASPDEVAFLQYTSGSTSAPKGVMVTHRNLAHQMAFNRRAIGLGPDVRAVMWVPQYHDFGLISGIFNALAGNGELTMMSPLSFIKRPALWLELMSSYRATHTAAPNVGYELAVRRTTAAQRARWDLGSLAVAMSAAEPVRPDTVRRFLDAFAASGLRAEAFCPSYGLAEHTVGVTVGGRGVLHVEREALERSRRACPTAAGRDGGDAARTVALHACGWTADDIDLRIVDPDTRRARAPGEVGEIWVDSDSKAVGYWGRPEESRETFEGRLDEDETRVGEGAVQPDEGASTASPRGYLRTGDLGFVLDGQLYVTGRLKDLIIIGGRNVYPQDIELTAERAERRVRPGGVAAFSVERDDGAEAVHERLVLVAELRRRGRGEAEAVAAALREATARDHRLACHEVVLIEPRTLFKTTSGKVQRRRVRQAWLDGELAIVHRSGPEAAAQERPGEELADVASIGSGDDEGRTDDEAPDGVSSIEEPAGTSGDARAAPSDARFVADAGALEDLLRRQLADVMRVAPERIDRGESLTSQGLSSLQAVAVCERLGQALDRDVPVALLFDHPSVASLAAALAKDAAAPSSESVPLTAPAATAAASPPPSIGSGVEPATPIAIVGIGCRFPGGVGDPASFWRLLSEGTDAIGEVPPERWNIDDYFDPTPGKRDRMITRWGGFLPDIDRFDPLFFGIKRGEAPSIDPQQRLLLECSWEALEHAGVLPADLEGSATGVYMGLCGNDYQTMAMAAADSMNAYSMIGSLHSTSVGRVSYALGLEGPNVPVDTACSSSLVAVHLACQAIRAGDCEAALAGGVNVTLIPEPTTHFSRMRAMSPDGRCRTFAAAANGYVRSEGCGVLMLKPLAEATRAGDRILAVIRGSAINQDGRSNGLTAPRGAAQRKVIRHALERAALRGTDIGYVECHGTGTPLGDPIEVRALAAALRPGAADADGAARADDVPTLLVGSVKSNIGHTEGAAGVAGLIKAVLSVRHGQVPASLHAMPTNEAIPWSSLGVAVADTPRAWPDGSGPRRAGVSSFGFSGTNAHVVVEQPPSPVSRVADDAAAPGARLFVLSAHTPAALAGTRCRLAGWLDTSAAPLPAIAATLARRRTAHRHRAAFVAAERGELAAALSRPVADAPAADALAASGSAVSAPRLAMLFAGQGAQRSGMGRELDAAFPVFAATLDRLDALLDVGVPVRDLLYGDAGRLAETWATQPALFAFEVALFELWRSFGVAPDVLVGHSLGEYAAAHAAGVLELADACRLVGARARLMEELTAPGAVLAVAATEASVRPVVEPHGTEAAIALINAPAAVVVAGSVAAIEAIGRELSGSGIRCRRLDVSRAVHSPLVEPMLEPFRAVAESVRYHPPRRTLIAGSSGEPLGPDGAGAADGWADYWVRQLRDTVRFGDAIGTARTLGVTAFLEIGPGAVLLPAVGQTLGPDADRPLLASRDERLSEPRALLRALGAWWTHGGDVDWQALHPGTLPPVSLPTYAFDRRSYWLPSTERPRASSRTTASEAAAREAAAALDAAASGEAAPPDAITSTEASGTTADAVAETFAPWWRESGEVPMRASFESLGLTSLDRLELWSAMTRRFPALREARVDHGETNTLESVVRLLDGLDASPRPAVTVPLLVDTRDRFFFDHAYDHVPGIVVLDAIGRIDARTLDAGIAAAPADASPPTDTVVMSAHLRFERWLNLEGTCELRIETVPAPATVSRLTGTVRQRQDGRWLDCATFALTREPVPSSEAPHRAGARRTAGVATATTPLASAGARKHHRDNVLVGEAYRANGRWRCRALMKPDHPVASGRTWYSPTHLVEMARQMATGLVHRLAAAPDANERFILGGIALELLLPIAHGAGLVLEIDAPDEDARVAATDVTVLLLVGDRRVGSVVLSGQRVGERDYRRLRGLEESALD